MDIDNGYGVADEKDLDYLASLNKQLEKNPNDFNVLLKKGIWLFYPCCRTFEASALFDLLIKLYPRNYDVYFWYGESLFVRVGNHEKAAELLRIAIDIDPHRAEAYILLAQTLKQSLSVMGHHLEQEIERLLRNALQLEQYWPNAWYGLIYSLMRQKRYVEARQVIQDALCHIPTDYVESDDILQGRHDELVSGRDWTSLMEEDMRKYLQDIDEQEAKELEVKT